MSSINQIMSTSTSALLSSQNQISVATNNISNAGTAGYTRKTYEVTTVSSEAGVTIGSGEQQRISNDILAKSVNSQAADLGKNKVINDYMLYYDSVIGATDGPNLSKLTSDLQAAFNGLAAQPDSDMDKEQVVQSAQSLSGYINDLSRAIQSQRTEADQQIPHVVDNINDKLDNLERLNDDIALLSASGLDVTNLMDDQDRELEELSQLIGIQYFRNDQNRVTIYAEGGGLLLGSQANHLDYTAAGRLSGAETYPTDIPGITLNGTDITRKIQQGELAGLIDLRDEIFVGEQEKLDEFAARLIDETNRISNQGSAYPPPQTLTSDAGHAATDAFAGVGTLDVAVVSQSGHTQEAQAINLGGYATLGALVADLNTINGMSAGLSADGRLILSADNADNGVVLSGPGTDVNSTGAGFSDYFGFNDIFHGKDAASIGVTDRILAQPSTLPTSEFQAGSGMTAGGRALSASDSSMVAQMAGMFDADVAFGATSASAAQKNSLNDYGSALVSDAATLIADAVTDYEVSDGGYDYVKNMLSNETGVNIDEETALLTQYQNMYEANARLISMAREMYDVLLDMVN